MGQENPVKEVPKSNPPRRLPVVGFVQEIYESWIFIKEVCEPPSLDESLEWPEWKHWF